MKSNNIYFSLVLLSLVGCTTNKIDTQSEYKSEYFVNLSEYDSGDSLTGYIIGQSDTTFVNADSSQITRKICTFPFYVADGDSIHVSLLLWKGGIPIALVEDSYVAGEIHFSTPIKTVGTAHSVKANIFTGEDFAILGVNIHNYTYVDSAGYSVHRGVDYRIVVAGWDYDGDNNIDDSITISNSYGFDSKTMLHLDTLAPLSSIQVNFLYELSNGIAIKLPFQISKMGSFVDNRDGNIYTSINMGSLDWMGEDLRYFEAKYWPKMLRVDGRKAVWYNAILSDSLELCPDGWRLPSISEWNNLSKSLTANSATQDPFDQFEPVWGFPDVTESATYWTSIPKSGFRVCYPNSGSCGDLWATIKMDGGLIRCVRNGK